jgi:predicted patatin/cPLA2 family phospholipase
MSMRKSSSPVLIKDLAAFEALSDDILRSGQHLRRYQVKVEDDVDIGSNHPVVKLVMDRYRKRSKPGRRDVEDKAKIALSIEGGGMRGCVAAGASAAIHFLGLNDAIDVVYGSSAGAMIGAYFVSRQFSGIQIYHDILPAAGKLFIDKIKLLFAAGLPSALAYLLGHRGGNKLGASNCTDRTSGKEFVENSNSNIRTDVFNLDFLLEYVMGNLQPLDWDTFSKNERVQPLHVVASSLHKLQSVVFSRANGNYNSLSSFLLCVRASMSVPGITGKLMGTFSGRSEAPSFIDVDSINGGKGKEHHSIADAFMCEPMPYRSAIESGATHVIVLRTRPDPSPVLGKGPGVFERIISKRFFARYKEDSAQAWLMDLQHHRLYAEDILRLNEGSKGKKVMVNGKGAYLLPIAPGVHCKEVDQLELDREKILRGMQDGCRQVLRIFAPELNLPESCVEDMLQMILPDSILLRKVHITDYGDNSIIEAGVLI